MSFPRFLAAAAVGLGFVVGAPAVAQENDPNACDQPGERPDVIVGDIDGAHRWGNVDGITAFSIGTWSCNVGTCELQWSAATSDHPVIAQNMYRLRDGRFEQIGQSWLKHGFATLNEELCDTGCVPTDGSTLGVRCSDPYGAGLNGNQSGLGPKFEVNPATGEFPYPPTDGGLTGDAIYKRLQVHDADLEPLLNTGALYFVEAQYVARDDAEARNQTNNTSYRQVAVFKEDRLLDIAMIGETVRTEPAIVAWSVHDTGVLLDVVDVSRDGRFVVGSKATELSPGVWSYEYAVQNSMSHRGARALRIPVHAGATVHEIGFHDVDYHSGEPFDGTDWEATFVDDATGRHLVWATIPFEVDPDANALRWGTLYNFRFLADVPPAADPGSAVLELFRPDLQNDVSARVLVPSPCDMDGICDPGETCAMCPEDCVGPEPQEYCCGDGTCDSGEEPCACAADCGPCLVPCDVAADCDDGLACNGVEECTDGFCAAGAPLCPDTFCDETLGTCMECIFSEACDDGSFCTGIETCDEGSCVAGADPCPGAFCIEDARVCAECLVDGDCDDGQFCNGLERCTDDACEPGVAPCGDDETCHEDRDVCTGCELAQGCDDGNFCNGVESCEGTTCFAGAPPCDAVLCDELHGACLDPETVPLRPGGPLRGLGTDALARFAAGRAAFERAFAEADGLGPAYNATSCAGCHATAAAPTVTRFGADDAGEFDPLAELGGTLLQREGIRPECAETLPAAATIAVDRVPTTLLGAGLVEAVADETLLERETAPPPGVSGRAHRVPLLEDLGTLRIGRYGPKAAQASLLSCAAAEAAGEIGITSDLVPAEHAPNGDAALLAACDPTADPEDDPTPGDTAYVERVADYLRFLAPPPQTPQAGMRGEFRFVTLGCGNCHALRFTTAHDLALDPALRQQTFAPYSDFLLHDMGVAGDPTAEGGAAPGEVRTAPLWGLAVRSRLWHDGRFADPDFATRVRAAIAAHGAAGGEAAAAADAFAGASPAVQDQVVAFLGSLGRLRFDADRDGNIGLADFDDFRGCYPGPFADADAACAIHDADGDGDVDDDDYVRFLAVFDGRFGGAVPAGDAGESFLVRREPGGDLVLEWPPSCADDDDYAIYQGTLGDFDSHFGRRCTTGGARSIVLPPPGGSVYFLVAPTNGLTEGSLGADSNGVPRPAAGGSLVCLPRLAAATCD